MRRRPALAVGLAAVAPLLLAAPARADFCVGAPPCQPSLQAAIDLADSSPGTDTITVEPGTFTGGLADADNPVDIVGAGAIQSTLVLASPGDRAVLDLDAAGSSASSLHISVPSSKRGLELTDSVGSDLLVDAPSAAGGERGVILDGASRLERSTIALSMPPGSGNVGLQAENAGVDGLTSSAADVTVSAQSGVTVGNDGMLALRSARISAPEGINVIGSGGRPVVATLDDVLLTVPAPTAGTGFATGADGADATLTLRNVTARGSGAASVGALAKSAGAIHIGSSSFSNFAADLDAQSLGTIDANFSNFSSVVPGTGNIAGDPGFLDAAGGDFRLPFSSPLVDAGDPGPLLGPATDLAGAARLVNGRVDIGAFEYQRRPPVPSITVSQGSPKTGDPVGFDGSGSSDPDPGDSPLSFAWTFDDGGTASGPSTAHVFTTAGTHTATLTVTDPAGASASVSRIVEIGAQPINMTLPPVPSLSSFSATNSRVRSKRGTTFRYTLGAAARSTRISIDALLSGKRSGRSCVKPTRKLARAKGCTRSVAKGGISGPAAAGRNTLAWDGRLNRKALAPGRYKATARATDRFGRLSNTRTLTFTIVASR
jgi:PKD domain